MKQMTPQERAALVQLLCALKQFLFDKPANPSEAEKLIDKVIVLAALIED
jgi:hypothetical protein